MANDTRKLSPVPLSELTVIEEPKGFWIFGSKEEGGKLVSGRYQFDRLEEYASRLQLERRISATIENNPLKLFIGEEMTIYRIETKNVGTLKIGDTEIDLKRKAEDNTLAGAKLNIKVKEFSVLNFDIEKQLSDPQAYLFIYAKARMI